MPTEYVAQPNGRIDKGRQVDLELEMASIETRIENLGENWPADPLVAIRELWHIRRRVREAKQLVLAMVKTRETWWGAEPPSSGE